MRGCCISADYASTIGLSLVKGEMLQDGEDDKLLITETAARLMGDGDPIGAKIYVWAEWRDKTVKGVVKDIYYESPTAAPEALCFDLMEKGAEADRVCHYVFRYREGTDWNALCDKINTAVSHHTDKTLITEKAEDIYDQCISSERTMCSLLTIMAGVCIFITVFSLLGMVSLSCRRRRKEIAIRKVHGAKRLQIVRLFLRSYIHALLVGSAVSLPVGYWLMHQWLMDYHKQASIPWWLYPAIVVTMGLVMFLTVFHQIYKASRENPADVLKSE